MRLAVDPRLVDRGDRATAPAGAPGRRPARRAASTRSCRRAGASPPRSGRRRRRRVGAQLGELRPLGDEAPPDPRRLGAAVDERPLERGEVEVRRCPPPGSRPASMQTASSASRTNIAVRSASVCMAIVRRSTPRSTRSSRTALIRRIAASPRLTTAMRRNPRSIAAMVGRACHLVARPSTFGNTAPRRRVGAPSQEVAS